MLRVLLAALVALGPGCAGGDDDGEGAGVRDCEDPHRPAGVDWRDVVADADGDGYGAGAERRVCLGPGDSPPVGWVLAGGPTDCAPGDPSLWGVLAFASRDADLDGVLVEASGEICSGAALPAGHLEEALAGEADCDDANAGAWRLVDLFADVDGDGFGSGSAATRCIGEDAPPGESLVAGDCAPDLPDAWALLVYYHRDADGDGTTIPESGQLCSDGNLPPGYAISPGPLSPDCDDDDPLRFRQWAGLFADEDGDGVGVVPAQSVCAAATVPIGYSTQSGDCAEADATRWRLLAYSFRDADLDTYTVAQAGTICSGTSRPPGYRTDPGAGPDCDDGDPVVFLALTGFVDSDGDGIGAGPATTFCTSGTLPAGAAAVGGDCAPADPSLHTSLVSFADADGDGVGAGAPVTQCTGGTRPPGFVADGGDCAPADSGAWRVAAYGWVDRDGDDRTLAESGELCIGSALPPPYSNTPNGNDCDDADPALLGWAVLYDDDDGDGVGAGQRFILCIGAAPPATRSIHGDDANDQDPLIQTDEEDDDELDLTLS